MNWAVQMDYKRWKLDYRKILMTCLIPEKWRECIRQAGSYDDGHPWFPGVAEKEHGNEEETLINRSW
ncbi:hypothetical protein HUG15_12920 [Salicibibacter cibarius]|uniref:Uncharacterized protein n=1 Tax=Salicibibacter cibarius TaxID=2743000 RepID=A0A7T6Z402_9BACI|nr:hypothetical protein [Salicibibacter cibarius]QQK76372.1 hypothetical protein HUG15_12920 [Salicibibacter cibarius]